MQTSEEPKKLSAQEVLARFRRKEIIDAAYALARQDGFSRVTMERVAEQAGVAKGTIYTYFKDKADLIQVMVVEIGNEVLEAAKEAAGSKGTAKERLLNYAKTLEGFAQEHYELFRYVHEPNDSWSKGYPCDSEGQREQSEMFISLGAGIIEDGIRDGELRKVDPTTVSFFFLSSLHDLLLREILAPGIEIHSEVEYLVDIYLNGIKG